MRAKARTQDGRRIRMEIDRLDAVVRRKVGIAEQFFKRTGQFEYEEMGATEVAKLWHYITANGVAPRDLTLAQVEEATR